MTHHRAFTGSVVGILGLIMLGADAASADGAPGVGWSEPTLLFEDTEGFSRLDYMISDVSGAVHLFWSANPRSPYSDGDEYAEDETLIFYQRVRQDDWGSARDILVRSAGVMPFAAVVDARGMLHVMTTTGRPRCLAYLSIDSQLAGDPRAWPQPSCLDDVGVGAPDLAVDGNGVLYAIYATAGQKGIAVMSSLDGGRSWSTSARVASIADGEINLGFPRIAANGKGLLYAVWGAVQAPNGYPYLGLMFARSQDGGRSWTQPIELADGHQGDPNLAVFGTDVHAVWNGDAGHKGRYYRVSHDAGVTWSARMTLPLSVTTGGLQGAPAIVVDSAGRVHILYTDSARLYYISQQDAVWSQAVQIAGPENAGSVREINYPMLTITEGNELHASYTRDAQAVYYQEGVIDAPYEPPIEWPEPVALTPALAHGPAPLRREPPPTASVWDTTMRSPSRLRPPTMISAMLPALVVVGATLFLQLSRRRR